MILFNRICMLTAMTIILISNFIPKKYQEIRINIQCFLLGIELWAALNALLLKIFGV